MITLRLFALALGAVLVLAGGGALPAALALLASVALSLVAPTGRAVRTVLR